MEPFTLQRRQPADEPWLICALQHQVCGILMLACALGTGYLTVLENVDSLSAEHGMVVGSSQRIGNAFLIADPVAAVFRLSVDGVSGDAEYLLLLTSGTLLPPVPYRADMVGATRWGPV